MSFGALYERVKGASFESDKVAAIRSAASTYSLPTMTATDAGALLALFPFSAGKLEALELIVDHISDLVESSGRLVEAMSFSSDRDRATTIIRAALAKRPAGGVTPTMLPGGMVIGVVTPRSTISVGECRQVCATAVTAAVPGPPLQRCRARATAGALLENISRAPFDKDKQKALDLVADSDALPDMVSAARPACATMPLLLLSRALPTPPRCAAL